MIFVKKKKNIISKRRYVSKNKMIDLIDYDIIYNIVSYVDIISLYRLLCVKKSFYTNFSYLFTKRLSYIISTCSIINTLDFEYAFNKEDIMKNFDKKHIDNFTYGDCKLHQKTKQRYLFWDDTYPYIDHYLIVSEKYIRPFYEHLVYPSFIFYNTFNDRYRSCLSIDVRNERNNIITVEIHEEKYQKIYLKSLSKTIYIFPVLLRIYITFKCYDKINCFLISYIFVKESRSTYKLEDIYFEDINSSFTIISLNNRDRILFDIISVLKKESMIEFKINHPIVLY